MVAHLLLLNWMTEFEAAAELKLRATESGSQDIRALPLHLRADDKYLSRLRKMFSALQTDHAVHTIVECARRCCSAEPYCCCQHGHQVWERQSVAHGRGISAAKTGWFC
jgi:hypothetical protein